MNKKVFELQRDDRFIYLGRAYQVMTPWIADSGMMTTDYKHWVHPNADVWVPASKAKKEEPGQMDFRSALEFVK